MEGGVKGFKGVIIKKIRSIVREGKVNPVGKKEEKERGNGGKGNREVVIIIETSCMGEGLCMSMVFIKLQSYKYHTTL